jgi:parvulin-like peptidyl-prolyl isomerase
VGAKSGQRGRSNRDAGADRRQRLGLILFGALLALLFVGYAVAEGISSPSVPSGDVVIVEGVPEEIATISKEEYDRAFERQVQQTKLKKAPEPGSDEFEEVQEGALTELIDLIWVQAQAEEMDITATDKQVEDELASIKKQQFPTPDAYDKFLKESGYTQEDIDTLVKQQILGTEIQKAVNAETPAPSNEEIEDYYRAEKETQFTTKESRDVRVIINKDKGEVEAAKGLLEKDSSEASWKKVAAKYSTDPTSKDKGGLQEGISEEFLQGPIKSAIFDSPTGQLTGPVDFQGNFILVEVVKLNPAKEQALGEVRAQISSTLSQEKQQEFFAEFIADYESKWRSRTFCADGYAVPKCDNYKGDGHPTNAPAACYEEDPKSPTDECPAVVTPTSPALPGTVTEAEPKGKQFQQRPRPVATPEQGEVVNEEAAGAAGGAAPPPSATGE